jgi:hypothetical protein
VKPNNLFYSTLETLNPVQRHSINKFSVAGDALVQNVSLAEKAGLSMSVETIHKYILEGKLKLDQNNDIVIDHIFYFGGNYSG